MDVLQPQTVTSAIEFHAARQPGRVALLCEGRAVTYGEMSRESNRLARAIRGAGLGVGSRIAYLGKDSEQLYELLFACAKTGAVLVPINWRLTPPEVEHIARDSRAEVMFVEAEQQSSAQGAAGLPCQRVDLDRDGERGAGLRAWKGGNSAAAVASPNGPESPIVQIYTSGTTGLPKGVVLPERYFFKVRDGLAESGLGWIDWREDDVSLIGIPGFHVAGVWWAVQGFAAGVLNVAMPAFNSKAARHLIRRLGVTTTFVVPAMLQMMLAEAPESANDFATLRKVVYGGSPISESLLDRCLTAMGRTLVQVYGLTEAGGVVSCLPEEDHQVGSRLMRAAGRPFPGISLRILGPDGRPAPPDTVGEVCVRTPAAMLEYWQQPGATAQTLVDGWLHTGDAGYLDADGYLFISDRIKDTIIVAGENVYPAEVENALCRHPSVAEAAVIGVPDERWGEAIQALVVFRPEQAVSPRELMLSLRGTIADFKIPTRYEFLDALPRNPSGKILRRTLRDRYWASMDRKVN